jgi:hypothetical protein
MNPASIETTLTQPRELKARIVWGALFGFLSLLMLAVGSESALHFLGPAIDGPFQLYNALRRIWVGQRAGVDFQFFHGMGVPYVHYPFFRLLGGTFFASELSRQLVSAVLYPLTVILFLRFFLRDWTQTLAWSAIVMLASIALRMTSVLVAVNSLLGIRSTLPVLFPIVWCLPLRRSIRNGLSALTLGGALLLGTEQGLATLLALVIATAIVVVRERRASGELTDTGVAIGGAIATLVVGLLLLGGTSGMEGALRYNFRLVPMDQYWYFGSPPNLFIAGWGDLPAKFARIPRVPIGLAIGAFLATISIRGIWRLPAGIERRRSFAFTVGTLYAIISCASLLGTYANAYLQPMLRTLLLVGAVYLAEWLPRRDARLNRSKRLGVAPSVLMVAGASLLTMIAVVPTMFGTIVVGLPHVVVDHIIHHEGPVFSGIWPATIPSSQAILESRRTPDGKLPTLWSTYAGLLEARNGLFNPSFDYIIHALGPENRGRYVADFERARPGLVQTVDPGYTQYEWWIEETSWDFYSSLLRNYDVTASTPWSLFWQRRDRPLAVQASVWEAHVTGAKSLELPVAPVVEGYAPYVLVQVEMDYEIHNPLGALPIIGASPRYLVSAPGALQKEPVTLNPYVTRTRFPLIMTRGRVTSLAWETFSLLPGARLDVKAVRLSVVPLTAPNEVWLRALVDEQSRRMEQ